MKGSLKNMCAVISTNDGKQYQTPGFWPQAGAVIVGSMAGNMVSGLTKGVGPQLMNHMKELNKGVDTVELRKAVDSALESSGMTAKGVELIDVTGTGKKPKFSFPFKFPMGNTGEAVENAVENSTIAPKVTPNFKLKKALLTEMPAWLRKTPFGKLYISIIENMLTNGNNACYLPKANKVVVNMEKLGTSAFHEIGHSINRNSSKFWKVIQKTRTPFMITASTIPLIGLLKRKKVEGEEPKNTVDKATTFIKDHCGVLTSAAFVPVVAEELKATHRGNKLAKQLLSPELYKKVVKTNRFGAATYILTAATAGVAAFVVSHVRDLCSKPKEIKHS